MTDHFYGEAPVDLGELALPEWDEVMHYLYLPVRIPERDAWRAPGALYVREAVPERLAFLGPVIQRVLRDARTGVGFSEFFDPYVYVTTHRGFASPGNPLNRPGWHCDEFGGTDLNYIWADRFPTRLLLADGELDIPQDDAGSMLAMSSYAAAAEEGGEVDNAVVRIEDSPAGHLLRLSPYVIHDTPLIPEPGGMRSFLKISVSNHRYALRGNSHNHLLDYDWPMAERAAKRNQPHPIAADAT